MCLFDAVFSIALRTFLFILPLHLFSLSFIYFIVYISTFCMFVCLFCSFSSVFCFMFYQWFWILRCVFVSPFFFLHRCIDANSRPTVIEKIFLIVGMLCFFAMGTYHFPHFPFIRIFYLDFVKWAMTFNGQCNYVKALQQQ